MLSKLTSSLKWLLGAAAFIAAVFTMGRKSARDEIVAETEKQAAELQRKAHKANLEGEANENNIRDEINNKPVRDIDLD